MSLMASQFRNLSLRAFSRSRSGFAFTSIPHRNPITPFLNNNTTTAFPTLPLTLTQRSTMATSDAPKKMEWLVVVPDFPGVHQKRLEVRP